MITYLYYRLTPYPFHIIIGENPPKLGLSVECSFIHHDSHSFIWANSAWLSGSVSYVVKLESNWLVPMWTKIRRNHYAKRLIYNWQNAQLIVHWYTFSSKWLELPITGKIHNRVDLYTWKQVEVLLKLSNRTCVALFVPYFKYTRVLEMTQKVIGGGNHTWLHACITLRWLKIQTIEFSLFSARNLDHVSKLWVGSLFLVRKLWV